MQRSAGVAGARPLASASSSKAAEDKEETFVLRATPSIKRYNIARFDTPQLPRFQTCAQPVLMFREPERVIEDDEDGKEDEVVGYNPALRKRRRRRRKDTRTAGWVIEDQDGATKFNGVFEGGQASTYMLLVKNRHNDEFSVMPVEQWFRFKKPLNYRTLTLEEAEDLNNEKKRAVERWLMKHKLAGDDKADAGDTVSAPRVRTGAVGGGGGGGGAGGSAARAKKAEADDIFEVQESRPKRAARPKKAVAEGAQGEDGGDFDEKFDDDESDAEIEHEDKAVASSSDDEEFEVDPEGTGKLTETGQAMKDLLKRAQSGEMMGDAAKDADDKDDDNDDEDDDYSAKDMDKIKRDLGGNIIRDRADGGAGGGGSGGGASAADGLKAGVGNGADGSGAGGGDAGGSSSAVAKGAGSGVGDKRKADEMGKAKDETPSKAPKTAGGSGSLAANKLSEAGVQQELIRYGGRMRTRDLLKKLKKLLVTDNDRALLKDILRTICDVEVDAIDGRLLVLKSQFR
ncbi:hypothetical protein PybrP1_002389 [[Pythium] brassicae (nom. inval.)]|nr:hypothetical protein PybrP1_002389 [[Pythium] brassicae (nom. inval.)]